MHVPQRPAARFDIGVRRHPISSHCHPWSARRPTPRRTVCVENPSEEDYMKAFGAAGERYVRMPTALLAQIKKGS